MRLLISFALACNEALPVSVAVMTVSLVLTKIAVSPEGTFVAVILLPVTTLLEYVSPDKVIVMLVLIVPSLATASENVVAEYASEGGSLKVNAMAWSPLPVILAAVPAPLVNAASKKLTNKFVLLRAACALAFPVNLS